MSNNNQLIATALKKYIEIINDIKRLRGEIDKREKIRKQLAPVLMQYMNTIDQKKIKTTKDTLTYTTYRKKENFSKKCTERIAYGYFKNERKANEFMEYYEKHRRVSVAPGIKHTKPRKAKKSRP